MQIYHATPDHLESLAVLFNDYRIFYRKPSDLALARDFISRNLREQRSKIICLNSDANKMVAFCQLYPALCSLTLRDYYYLSDLYVQTDQQGKGYGRAIMDWVSQDCAANGFQRLTLDTAHSNSKAQALYRSLGYLPETEYLTFHLILDQETV